ncbi:MAG: RmuC family protein [Firmicutes bacterium ADurb.Bin248]|nr:MAG: RmuC family protein [Firmicutes bacterium ADurb.Bin248]HPK16513.1 DNA recombination protein RmuC [Clostridia bacterium]
METDTILLIILILLALLNAALLAALMTRRAREAQALVEARRETQESLRLMRTELAEATQRSVHGLGQALLNEQHRAALSQEERFKTFSLENEQKLENIRQTVERQLRLLQEDNGRRLDEMRGVVDEKLQKTLEERLTQSFALVSDRLEQVYKGLGEMQTLAAGVGDLSKVLSNVKTRGMLGEIQLGAILSEILTPEQYLTDAPVKKGASERVEFAVRLPAEDGESVLLPIDSKFPMDAYLALNDAYESGRPEAVKSAQEQLKSRVRGFARDIKTKYVRPPETTEFAVMFLPTEGLYAEVVKLGMVETLQREFRVNVAGPSTMAAFLNSLQMGFRTVAIQRRSGEVWRVLGAVKTEFDRFEEVLDSAQKRLDRVHGDLDTLIGRRTRSIKRTLRGVESLPEAEAPRVLAGAELESEDEAMES